MARLQSWQRLGGVCGLLLLLAVLRTQASAVMGTEAGSSLPAGSLQEEHHGGIRRLLHNGIDHGADEAAAETHEALDAPPPPAVNLRSRQLLANKGAAITVFFAVPFLGVWVPFFLPLQQELLKYGLLFASGLFFTLALEHLVMDSAQGFDALSSSEYPYAYLIVVVGYMLTWFADLIVHAIWQRKEERDQRLGAHKSVAEAEAKPSCCKKTVPVADEEAALARKCSGVNCKCDGEACRCAASVLEYSEHQEMLKVGAAVEASVAQQQKPALNEGGVHELGFTDLALLVLALCFHAVFEGLAVGLATKAYDVWTFTWQIVLHKAFEGMALGAALKAQNKNRSWASVVLYAGAFSIMAPVGIAIGIILNTSVESRAASWVNTIGNGLAAGVFIFVAVSHLMVKGFRKGPRDRWWTPFLKWSACALGVAVTSLCQIPH